MIVTIPTGSQMDRIVRCTASAALPQVYDANDADDRDRGSARHKFLERVPQVGREQALSEVDEAWRDACADIDLAKLADRLTLSTELALSYDWTRDTARILRPLEHRAYEVDSSCEIPLTLDLAGFEGDTVYAGDYKGAHGWLPPPAQSMQLGLGALALARLHGASRAQLEYIRIRDDGTPLRFSAELDILGLDSAADRIGDTMRGVARLRADISSGVTPTAVEGPWCRWCPAKQHCPAKTALIRSVIADPAITASMPITADNAAHAYRQWKRAREAMKMIEGALYSYSKLTPIPLGRDEDGSERWFGELRRPGNEELRGNVVHAVLTELYGGETGNAAVTMEATKTAIANAVRKVLPAGEKLTHHTTKVYDLVRERGGATKKETNTTTEYTVDAEGSAKARKKKTA